MTEDADGRRLIGSRRVVSIAIIFAALVVAGAVTLIARPGSIPNPPPSPARAAAVPEADPVEWADVRWEPSADSAGNLGGPLGQRIGRIVAGGPGVVAIGSASRGVAGAETQFAAVWSSVDAREWQKTELTAGVRPGDQASASLVAAGPAGLAIIGGVCCGEERPAIWSSRDGTDWERQPLPAGFGANASIVDLAGGPDGYVAVGSNNGRMAAWTSSDGLGWSAIDPGDAGMERGELVSVARDRDGWIAVGRADGRPTHDGVAWRSPDLTSWRPIPDSPVLANPGDEVEPFDLVPFASGYLLTGNLGDPAERRRCEAIGFGGLRLAAMRDVNCGWGIERQWFSADGETWILLPQAVQRAGDAIPPVRPPGRGLLAFGRLVAGGPGIVTIGYEVAGQNGPNDVTALWSTADGSSWRPVGGAPQFPPGAFISDIVVVGRQVVAVGESTVDGRLSGEDAEAWIGTIAP
jgi:hypothetical protein